MKAITDGRGKSTNIPIIGRANFAKTFLLGLLDLLFDTFCTLSNNKYAWVLIPWETFLILLEGEIVHFALAKSHFSKALTISSDVPIFTLQSQGLSILMTLMILLKARRWLLDGKYLSFPIKYRPLNKRIWHHVPNAFVICFCWKKC